MPEGVIVKALSGYYYVKPLENGMAASGGGDGIQCRARGIFKKKGVTPLVGDHIIYSHTENGEGMVDEILPRSSELIRPPVANVDLAVLVFSVREPELNLQLLDKFLVHIEHSGLDTVICLTKQDLLSVEDPREDPAAVVKELYENIGYQVIVSSSRLGLGTDLLQERLKGQISVFSGQSGVGKSSLLNRLVPGLALETSAISMRLGRGKHTTRHVELIELEQGGFVADTPGFSQLDFLELGVEELSTCFREFASYADQCKFRGCSHTHEPGCKVLKAVEEGKIAASRYEHYVLFLTEMKDKKRRY
ncbi:ribosome small subunit-dependent GTPase A [Paenibacillus sp. HJL G12]|uniref:Small ribosomal subunit biogenesis GTPase RsgA n=1 Tax=Paenibacillus dendrobii TaxID=2691084 RepID=A0A7X3LGT7_9BACL|nr:ribosome small subunit-dependent GTPase A [Paenibacillus dendrobii]MWV45126.1 ribosome small subunit-dependent GTPase A [Paenibacillus dendrobii]